MDAISVLKSDVQAVREACAELRKRLRAGESLRVEDLLKSYPALSSTDEAVLELIHVEIITRNDLGQRPTLDEWRERFPRLLPRMEQMVPLRSMFGSEVPTLSDATSLSANPLVSVQGPDARLPRIGNYQILQEIGRGGMGVVYKARQSSLSRIVALKMILAGEHAGLRERARLRIEAEAAAQLVHPNVVQIFEIGEHDGLPFLAMEYVPGGNLTRMLRGKPQAFRWSAKLTETLARAIHEAHRRGIVHRDLNPSNILIAQDGTPKISDFGLAKFLIDDHGISLNGVILGTPSYMSPEQISGNGVQVGPPADVYALGSLLYEMMTGAAPFRGFTPMETLCQVMEAELVPPSRLRHGVPDDLETICLKCLDRDPTKRYATAEDLADDLRRYNESQPIRARRTSSYRKVMQWRSRQPLAANLLALSTLLFAMLLALVSVYTVYTTQRNRELEKQSSKDEQRIFLQILEKAKFQEQVRKARRQAYDVGLNQVKQTLDAGEVELAQELFGKVESDRNPNDLVGFEWYYLDGLFRRTSRLLEGHRAQVTCLCVSPGGRTMVSGDSAGTIIAWDLGRQTSRIIEEGLDTYVQRIALDCDNQDHPRTIASVRQRPDKALELKLRAAENGVLLAALRSDPLPQFDLSSRTTTLQFSRDGDILSLCATTAEGSSGEVLTWSRQGARWNPDPDRRVEGITRVAFSPDGKLLAEGGINGLITLRGLNGHRPAALRERKGGTVLALSFSRDGKRLAAGRKDHSLTVWDVTTGQILMDSPDEDGPVSFLDFCLDGETLVACAGSALWTQRMSGRGVRRILPKAEGRLHSVRLSPDGRTLAAGGWNQPVNVWDLASGRQERSYLPNNRFVVEFAFGADENSIVLGCDDQNMRIWSFREGPESGWAFAERPAEAWVLAFSPPEGEFLACGGDDHVIRFWDLRTEQECLTLRGHDQTVTSLAFFSDGRRLASVGLDGRLILWDLERGGKDSTRLSARPTVLHQYKDRLRSVTVSMDGRHLAVGGSAGPIEIWDLDGRRVLHRLTGHNRPVHALLYSPNPSVLVSASGDGTLRFWEVGSGAETYRKELKDPLKTLAFSRNGQLLAAAGDDRVVTTFLIDSWTPGVTLQGHPLTVRSVAFSPDQQTLATGCDDAKVRLWDVATGQLFYTLRGHSDRVNSVAFSPDGKLLASCDHKGMIRLWRGANPRPFTPIADR